MHTLKHVVGYLLPLLILGTTFFFIGDGVFNGASLVKATGTAALYIFGIIFIIGPLPRFWHDLTPWKVFRPYWAKWAVILALVHMLLAYVVTYDQNILFMLSRENPRILAVLCGILALSYFIFMVVISEISIRERLGPLWKKFHTIGYIAFTLATLHYFLAESEDGHFVVRHFLEQTLFAFAVIVLVLRGYVAIWARVTDAKTPEDAGVPLSH